MKTLNDVINAVQHETQLSRSQMSLKIGKSRNYLSEVLRSGVSHEKEQEIINLLLELVDDEIEMLRNVLADKEENIESYKLKIKDVVIEKNNKVEYLKRVIKSREEDLSLRDATIDNHIKEIATKNLFIDGLDLENKGLMDRISNLEKTIESLKKSNEILGNDIQLKAKKINSLLEEDHPTRKQLNKEITKNRVLTTSIIGLVAIFSVYLWVK